MSLPSKEETKDAATAEQEMIQREKDSVTYTDYHAIERPPSVSNAGSMPYAQLVSFFDNISNEKNKSMCSLKVVKLFDVR